MCASACRTLGCPSQTRHVFSPSFVTSQLNNRYSPIINQPPLQPQVSFSPSCRQETTVLPRSRSLIGTVSKSQRCICLTRKLVGQLLVPRRDGSCCQHSQILELIGRRCGIGLDPGPPFAYSLPANSRWTHAATGRLTWDGHVRPPATAPHRATTLPGGCPGFPASC